MPNPICNQVDIYRELLLITSLKKGIPSSCPWQVLVFDIHYSASVVVDCKSWTLEWNSLSLPGCRNKFYLSYKHNRRKRKRSDPVLKKPPTPTEKAKRQRDNTQTQPKTSITQRLRTDLGRSVGVISAIQQKLLNRPTGSQTSSFQIIESRFAHYEILDMDFLYTGSWSPSPLIVSRDSYSLWTLARVQNARGTAYFNGSPYILSIY